MTLTYIDHVGLMVAGHNHPPAALVDEARQWLVDHAGMTALDAMKMVDITSIQEAWPDSNFRFLQQGRPGAIATTIVNIPLTLPVNVDPAVAIAARRQLAREAARQALIGLDAPTRAAVIAEVGP